MRAAALGMMLLCLSQVANAQPAAVTNPKSADAQIFSVPKLLKPQSDGAVDASYNAAWQAYELGVQTATEKLAAVMTGQFEEAVEKGDLELAEMWEARINSLKQTGTVAMAKFPVGAVDAAQKSYEESKAKLKVEYDTLVKEYTKKKNLTRARQLKNEIDNLLKPRDDSPSPEEVAQPDTIRPAAPDKIAKDPRADTELHMVCLREGLTKTDGQIHGGRATVTVDRPGKTVVLFLGAYQSVTWKVMPGKDTRIGKVFLGGYHEQAIQDLPKDAELLEVYYEKTKGAGGHLMAFGQEQDHYFWNTVHSLAERTGLNVSSYQGLPSPVGAIAVNSLDDPKKNGFDLNPTPVEKLPQLKFQGVSFSGRKAAFGPFTLAGPEKETLKPLPDGIVSVAYDPVGKKVYGLGAHALRENTVFEVDLDKGTAAKMSLGLDVPMLHRPSGITFDTKRQRLLVLSSPGYLYVYDTEKGKWSALAEIESPRLVGLVYDKTGDALYGLTCGDDPFGVTTTALVTIGMDGKVVNPIKLSPAIFPDGLDRFHRDSPLQLIAAGGQLVVVTSGRQYVIDPKSGQSRLVWKK